MNDLLDKILVILLIITLPLSIYLTSKSDNNPIAQPNPEAVVAQAPAQPNPQVEKPDPIIINDVSYATQTGQLKIVGVAPIANLNIMVSAVVTKSSEKNATNSAQPSPSAQAESILGKAIEVIAVKTNEKGKFTFAKIISDKSIEEIEIRFEQAESTTTIQYDLLNNKRTL
jgi:negative regulator of sigma E activity